MLMQANNLRPVPTKNDRNAPSAAVNAIDVSLRLNNNSPTNAPTKGPNSHPRCKPKIYYCHSNCCQSEYYQRSSGKVDISTPF